MSSFGLVVGKRYVMRMFTTFTPKIVREYIFLKNCTKRFTIFLENLYIE